MRTKKKSVKLERPATDSLPVNSNTSEAPPEDDEIESYGNLNTETAAATSLNTENGEGHVTTDTGHMTTESPPDTPDVETVYPEDVPCDDEVPEADATVDTSVDDKAAVVEGSDLPTTIEKAATVTPVDEVYAPKHAYSRTYRCPHCDFSVKSSKGFLYHLIRVHNRPLNVYACNYCEYGCKQRHKVQRHLKLVHRKPTHIDDIKCEFQNEHAAQNTSKSADVGVEDELQKELSSLFVDTESPTMVPIQSRMRTMSPLKVSQSQ